MGERLTFLLLGFVCVTVFGEHDFPEVPVQATPATPQKSLSLTLPGEIPPGEEGEWEVKTIANIEVEIDQNTDVEALQSALDAIAKGESVSGDAARAAQDLIEQASSSSGGLGERLATKLGLLPLPAKNFDEQASTSNIDRFKSFGSGGVADRLRGGDLTIKDRLRPPTVARSSTAPNLLNASVSALPVITKPDPKLSYNAPVPQASESKPPRLVSVGASSGTAALNPSNSFFGAVDGTEEGSPAEFRRNSKVTDTKIYKKAGGVSPLGNGDGVYVGTTAAIPGVSGSLVIRRTAASSENGPILLRRKVAKNLSDYLKKFRKGNGKKGIFSKVSMASVMAPAEGGTGLLNALKPRQLLSTQGPSFKAFSRVSQQAGFTQTETVWSYYIVLAMAWLGTVAMIFYMLWTRRFVRLWVGRRFSRVSKP